jgi:hypothetical protein
MFCIIARTLATKAAGSQEELRLYVAGNPLTEIVGP